MCLRSSSIRAARRRHEKSTALGSRTRCTTYGSMSFKRRRSATSDSCFDASTTTCRPVCTKRCFGTSARQPSRSHPGWATSEDLQDVRQVCRMCRESTASSCHRRIECTRSSTVASRSKTSATTAAQTGHSGTGRPQPHRRRSITPHFQSARRIAGVEEPRYSLLEETFPSIVLPLCRLDRMYRTFTGAFVIPAASGARNLRSRHHDRRSPCGHLLVYLEIPTGDRPISNRATVQPCGLAQLASELAVFQHTCDRRSQPIHIAGGEGGILSFRPPRHLRDAGDRRIPRRERLPSRLR